MESSDAYMLLCMQAEMAAIQARIESMKAENAVRAANGSSPSYGEDAFYQESLMLAAISASARSRAG
jgi:hypothetical protein